jgi:hypothetical protein
MILPHRDRTRAAFQATRHCLTGCAIGEMLGLVLSTALGWTATASIVLAIVLAFGFGYSLTIGPLVQSGIPLRSALGLAFASDTVSITVMEVVDNAFVLAVSGAMTAGLTDALFWISLIVSLALAFVVAFPVNLWLIDRGLGHAVIHDHMGH